MELPNELRSELTTMRRDPANFTLVRRARCKFCEEQSWVLTHPSCVEAGAWCVVHGWLYFASNQIEPEW